MLSASCDFHQKIDGNLKRSPIFNNKHGQYIYIYIYTICITAGIHDQILIIVMGAPILMTQSLLFSHQAPFVAQTLTNQNSNIAEVFIQPSEEE